VGGRRGFLGRDATVQQRLEVFGGAGGLAGADRALQIEAFVGLSGVNPVHEALVNEGSKTLGKWADDPAEQIGA
jgi:hypothetical protein